LGYLRPTVGGKRNKISLRPLITVSPALGVECVIVTLTIIGLRKFDPKSGFANLLIRQGLGFFFLVLLFQIFVTVSQI
jgi:hypothetical protein